MAKIDSSTATAAQVDSNDDESPALETAKVVGGKMLDSGIDSYARLVPFSKDDLVGNAKDAYEWAAHHTELPDLAKQLQQDPKGALSKMGDAEASWVLRSMSEDDKAKVADTFARAGMTKKVAGESAPSGAPKPPALYEVNSRQAPVVKDFLHEQNVAAARDYRANYDAYSDRTDATRRAPFVSLREPGSGAEVFEEMTLRRASSPKDYAVGKLDDLQHMTRIDAQFDRLGVGDEAKMSVGAEASVGEYGGGASFDLKVKRSDDGYTLSPQLSESGLVQLNKELKGGLGATAGVEFHSDTLADAHRVTDLLSRLNWSSADAAFMKSQVSGYDLKGSEALKYTEQVKESGASLTSANGKKEMAAHLDVRHHTLTVTDKVQLSASSFDALKVGNVKVSAQSQPWLTGEASLETKYPLPSSVKSPGDALKAMKNVATGSEQTLKVRLEASGERGIAVEGTLSGSDSIGRALGALAKGGTNGLTEQLMKDPNAKAKVDLTTNETQGGELKLGGSDYSLKLGATSTRTHHQGHGATWKDAMKQLLDAVSAS